MSGDLPSVVLQVWEAAVFDCLKIVTNGILNVSPILQKFQTKRGIRPKFMPSMSCSTSTFSVNYIVKSRQRGR